MFAFRKRTSLEVRPSDKDVHQLFLGWKSPKEYRAVLAGKAKDDDENLKYLHLDSLVEQGIASWASDEEGEEPRGVFLDAQDACRIPESLKLLFEYPRSWDGVFKLVAPEPTHSVKFSARIEVAAPGRPFTTNWSVKGNLLFIGELDEYSLTWCQLSALNAFEGWRAIAPEDRKEADHQILLARLQRATKGLPSDENGAQEFCTQGAKIDIGFPELEFGQDDWEISMIETDDGGLQLLPTPASDGREIDPENILRRLGQFNQGDKQATFRYGKKIITLTKEQTARSRDILKRGKLNSVQRRKFLENPAAYLADYVFNPDDIEWSPRVKGIAEWEGPVSEKNEDGQLGRDALSVTTPGDKPTTRPPSTSPGSKTKSLDRYLPYPFLNFGVEEFAECSATDRIQWGVEHAEIEKQRIEKDVLRHDTKLKSYQKEAVKWMLAHAGAIDSTADQKNAMGDHFSQNRGGVLLADDMGLGKTITVLSFLANRQIQLRAGGENGAFLVIAPVSLLLGWKEELEKRIAHENIFDEVVILHREHDLDSYRVHPKSIDKLNEDEDGVSVKELGLRKYDPKQKDVLSIDKPGNLVITNYETVQRFRFSFCAAKWDVLALDEAQITKNPNILTTASIKSLDADFRVLMTGTPVENSLVDFWCLNDTHSPGLFCSLSDFREKFVNRIRRADSEDVETRRAVAAEVKKIAGETMLRRMKCDILDKDFPKKITHRFDNDEALSSAMSGQQLSNYDSLRLSANQEGADHHFALLHKLKSISLHPNLTSGEDFPIGKSKAEAEEILRRSIKGRQLVDYILPKIKSSGRGEKVLIFVIDKSLQWGLARNLEMIYPELRRIPIINGDTKIRSTRANPSRKQLKENFEASNGFNICILSPVAAGVGLTITAANHVVHYERHLNPAKEAQATDRAYRIGQTKDVHVWYPIARHPESDICGYDQAVDRLMDRKASLQDAVLSVESSDSSKNEVLMEMRRNDVDGQYWSKKSLLDLSPGEFEALIACLYEKAGASKVVLTQKGGDGGGDIIAWDYPELGQNCIADAKHVTASDTYNAASELAGVHTARDLYEGSLGERIHVKQLITNAPKVGDRVQRDADKCEIEIVKGQDLLEMLQNHDVTLEGVRCKMAEDRISRP